MAVVPVLSRLVNRLRALAVPLSCGVAFLLLPYVFTPRDFVRLLARDAHPHERSLLLTYFVGLLLVYLNYYVLVPRLYIPRHYGRYVLSLGASLLLTLGVLYYTDHYRPVRGLDHPPPIPRAEAWKPPVTQEMRHVGLLFLAGSLAALTLRVQRRFQEAEALRLRAELASLRAQINPHFLFNSLNSLYALALAKSDTTPDALVRLAELMRYSLQEARAEQVPLTRELAYLRHYIALQQLRLNALTTVEVDLADVSTTLVIAPLLLISFVENAFKYGVSSEVPSLIRLQVRTTEQVVHLHVYNQKVRTYPRPHLPTGLGLTNTRARLQLLYPTSHLTVHDTPRDFTVDLVLPLS